jgi:hypothetical protein
MGMGLFALKVGRLQGFQFGLLPCPTENRHFDFLKIIAEKDNISLATSHTKRETKV